jgi:hypothetical protein
MDDVMSRFRSGQHIDSCSRRRELGPDSQQVKALALRQKTEERSGAKFLSCSLGQGEQLLQPVSITW